MDYLSSPVEVTCKVPRPIVVYSLHYPLSYLIQIHNVKHHLYADDTQIYLSISIEKS